MFEIICYLLDFACLRITFRNLLVSVTLFEELLFKRLGKFVFGCDKDSNPYTVSLSTFVIPFVSSSMKFLQLHQKVLQP